MKQPKWFAFDRMDLTKMVDTILLPSVISHEIT